MKLPQTAQLEAFLNAFEAATIPKEEWHHDDHVVMAFGYLARFDEAVAIEKIKIGIQNLVRTYGVPQTETMGYHETWTIFFSKILAQFMRHELDRTLPLCDQIRNAVSFLKDFKGKTGEYYSRKLILSWTARTSWIPPDLKAL